MPAYFFAAMFKKSKVGTAPANAPTVDVIDVATNTLVVSGGTPGTLSNMTGVYTYTYSGVAGNYIAMFKTADTTVDAQHVPSYTPQVITDNLDAAISSRNATTPPTAAANATAVRSELATELARVDVATSTRLASAAYAAAPSAATVADAVWDEALSGHATAGTAGKALTDAGGAGNPWTVEIDSGDYVAPMAGYYISLLANNRVQISSNFDPATMALSYYFGDDYKTADSRQQTFTTAHTLTGGAVAFEVRNASALVSIPCTIVDAHTYALELTAANLATITVGVWQYHLRMSLPTSADKITEVYGTLLVSPDVR